MYFRLKYLALKLCQYVIGGFIQLSWKITRLQALELYIFDQTKGNWTDELFEVIVSNCPNLRHFAFHLLEENHVNGDKLALLASLPNLCSVHIRSGVSTGRVPVWTLFRKLSLSGRLKYFYTDEALFVKDVCEALDQCRYFTNIYCSRRDDEQQTEVFHQMLTTLDKIHEGEPIPATVNDERILHICFGGSRKDKLPKHPWAKFYADELDIFLSVPLSASRVREQIRFGVVSIMRRPSESTDNNGANAGYHRVYILAIVSMYSTLAIVILLLVVSNVFSGSPSYFGMARLIAGKAGVTISNVIIERLVGISWNSCCWLRNRPQYWANVNNKYTVQGGGAQNAADKMFIQQGAGTTPSTISLLIMLPNCSTALSKDRD
uniref:FBD domain-containing protein n=1 Tax=Ditylenchus dipsaci TaxID=166011 RepID=A0A915DUC6_9BILA